MKFTHPRSRGNKKTNAICRNCSDYCVMFAFDIAVCLKRDNARIMGSGVLARYISMVDVSKVHSRYKNDASQKIQILFIHLQRIHKKVD